MANPKGNLKTLTPFVPQGKKPLKGHLAVKVDADDLAIIKEFEGWQDEVRKFIKLLAESKKESDRNQETSTAA